MKNKKIFRARYDKSFWNAHCRVINSIPRTTNSLEAWNKSIKNVVRIPHPNIVNLILSLQKEQIVYEKKMIDSIKRIKTSQPPDISETGLYNLCSNYNSFCGPLYLKAIVNEYKWKLEDLPTGEPQVDLVEAPVTII